MKTNKISLLLFLITIFATSCTKKVTRIKLVNDCTNYNLGEIQNQASILSGKEWLIQNVGDVNLKIDKVELSCDCLKVIYDSVNTIKPNKYLPFRVLVSPEGTIGDFYREIYIYGNFQDSPLKLTIEGCFVEDKSE